jgi:pre-rRNA-processing protein TSR3
VRQAATSSPAVLLDPFAREALSGADRELAERGGLLVIDCSWNRLGARGSFPSGAGPGRDGAVRRRLPILVAGNPQHFGRVAELNTVEAFAAALSVVGRGDEARSLLAGFPGGDVFLELNRDRFDRYGLARSGADIEAAEREMFDPDDR